MRAYASRFDGDVELWGLTGLLHDLDYERYPDLHTGHPRYAMDELRRLGYPEELIRAVASHAPYLGVSRETPMEKALFAVDELSGFVLACAYVRPEGLVGMTPKSVQKKLKQPSFAAAIHRDELRSGAEELGVDFDEHLAFVIEALAAAARGADARARRRRGVEACSDAGQPSLAARGGASPPSRGLGARRAASRQR